MTRPSPRQVTSFEAHAFVGSTIIGAGVLALPRLAVETAGTGGPLATALAVGIAVAGSWLFVALGRRHPGATIFDYGLELLGPWLGRLAGAAFAGFFTLQTGLAAREFGEVVITVLLQRTPLEVSIAVMLVLAGYSARHGTPVIARLHGFYVPLIFFPGLTIVLLSLKDAHFTHLLPVAGEEGGLSLVHAALKVGALFHGLAVLGLVLPYLRDPRRAWRAAWTGAAMSGSLYAAVVAGTLAVFGKWETELLRWPLLELARQTFIAGGVIERLDAVFVAIWVTAVFTTLLSTYHLASVGLSRLLGLRDFRGLVFPQLPVLFAVALWPENIETLYLTILHVGMWGFAFVYGYPALLLLLSGFRGRRAPEGSGACSPAA